METICRVRLERGAAPVGGAAPPPAALEICQTHAIWQGVLRPYFYLIALDEHSQSIGDTWHESLAEAEAQAQYQYGVRPDQWRSVE